MAPTLQILTGCTAVGKTELALSWAEQYQAEIVSCDSLLFYRGADIGTAKPTGAERARVRHHLIDVRDLTDRMNVAEYVDAARIAIRDILERGRSVLVVGGSGFYLRAFFAPVADDVGVPAAIRGQVQDLLATRGLPAVVAALAAVNPEGLGQLDVDNPRRVTRALERCLASGRTLAALEQAFRAQPPPLSFGEVRLCELVREADDLRRRVRARVDAMLAAGLVDEVRALEERGLAQNSSVAGAIGYRETRAMLAGQLAAEDLAEAIARNTWRLVRKQRTWFRTQLPPHAQVDAASADPRRLFAAPV